MHKSSRKKLLIIDDSVEHIKLLIAQLVDSYELFFARGGEEGLALVKQISPDLILLDIIMPDMDGFAVLQQLKKDQSTKEIPVFFLSARGEEDIETQGLELGAIDYITKPFNPAIVRARIKNQLQLQDVMHELSHLYSLALDANPVTGLPGNNTIARQIEQHLIGKNAVCVLYLDIDNFKPFNDRYGFARGDEVIRFFAKILQETGTEIGCRELFVGHVGGDDFIVAVEAEKGQELAQMLIKRFDRDILNFYNRQDIQNRCIHSINRRGEKQIFPIMSVSIAGVDMTNRTYATYLEINDACTEMKTKAKAIPGSTVCFDRRRE
jgi:diguanylate cyclase (GGDEF)-like protein